jgi:hypothetical protein
MAELSFTRVTIGELENDVGEGAMNTLFTVGDVNGDGWPDIVACGRNGLMAWFENRGGTSWERRIVAEVRNQECGGVVHPLTGDGFGHIINGGDWKSDELCWWENPGAQGARWRRHVITKTGYTQFHDVAVGDVTGDGRQSLVFWNEGSGTLYWCPLPEDPRSSPWPGISPIATGMRECGQPEEGIALGDIDGDGVNEVVAGVHWYKHVRGRWEAHRFASGYITTVLAIGDINGDGRNEIVLSEGDPCIYGRPEGGRLSWFGPADDVREMWEEHVLADHLLDAHSLQLGDVSGAGHLDILVGEIGLKDACAERPPRLMVFQNDGAAGFSCHVIDEGTGSHHARLADFRRIGVLDIASRPLHGPDKWKLFVWYSNRQPRLSTVSTGSRAR